MSYCCHCGSPVTLKIPVGDNVKRYVCESCEAIHYQNPNIVTGTIPTWDNKVLLCRRAIEPRMGYWTTPAGFMENYETVQEGAARETWEEARAKVTELKLFGVFNLPHISQVYMMFTGIVVDGKCAPGPESIETAWFTESEIPWDKLAFPVIHEALSLFYEQDNENVYTGDIYRQEDNKVVIKRY